MHGNTVRARSRFKTKNYGDIVDALRGFVEVLASLSEWPGGVHLELAADDVTECVGGGGPDVGSPSRSYRSLCDPRLNNVQASGADAENRGPAPASRHHLAHDGAPNGGQIDQGEWEVQCGHF